MGGAARRDIASTIGNSFVFCEVSFSLLARVSQDSAKRSEHTHEALPPRKTSSPPMGHSANLELSDPTSPIAATASSIHAEQERTPADVNVLGRPTWRIDWATLLKRVHDVDALACPCGGRLKFVQLVTEPVIAKEILQGMGLLTEAPPIARARSPDLIDDLPPDDWE